VSVEDKICTLSLIIYKHYSAFLCLCHQIDLKKMPLGKLSKKQIESAYKVLTELQQVSYSAA